MITWLVGENSFEIHEAQQAIENSFHGQSEYIDATDLTIAQLPDLLMGTSLFSFDRLVIIRGISDNKALWDKLPEWLARINSSIHVVFIDKKPDKRTLSYKALKTAATIHEFLPWSDKDTKKAVQWVLERAKLMKLTLSNTLAQQLVYRAGVDQWQLTLSLEILSLFEVISAETIDNAIPMHPQQNVFEIFQAAIEQPSEYIRDAILNMKVQQDPYAFFALLSSQVLNLSAITFQDNNNASKDFAIHPYVARSLRHQSKQLGKKKVRAIMTIVAQTDTDIKHSRAEPWVLIEVMLLQIHHVAHTTIS